MIKYVCNFWEVVKELVFVNVIDWYFNYYVLSKRDR